MTAFDDKIESAEEVHRYLMENFSRYLGELLRHAHPGASEHEIDDLIATALDPATKQNFLDDIENLNNEFARALNSKKAEIIKHIHTVKGGKELKHKHDERGRLEEDEDGNHIILQEAVPGFDGEARAVQGAMWDTLEGIIEAQKAENSDANEEIEKAATGAADWVDDSARGELTVLSDFLEQGFSIHVDTTDFIQHTSHPYAPFSTGAYNSLVDKINGLEQFFGYWKRTKEGAIDQLDSCKALEKSSVYADVFE